MNCTFAHQTLVNGVCITYCCSLSIPIHVHFGLSIEFESINELKGTHQDSSRLLPSWRLLQLQLMADYYYYSNVGCTTPNANVLLLLPFCKDASISTRFRLCFGGKSGWPWILVFNSSNTCSDFVCRLHVCIVLISSRLFVPCFHFANRLVFSRLLFIVSQN